MKNPPGVGLGWGFEFLSKAYFDWLIHAPASGYGNSSKRSG
jgi:hypothetical protein